jgi:hypothetical protein
LSAYLSGRCQSQWLGFLGFPSWFPSFPIALKMAATPSAAQIAALVALVKQLFATSFIGKSLYNFYFRGVFKCRLSQALRSLRRGSISFAGAQSTGHPAFRPRTIQFGTDAALWFLVGPSDLTSYDIFSGASHRPVIPSTDDPIWDGSGAGVSGGIFGSDLSDLFP